MNDKKIPVTYVLYPDEGHGFHRPENNKSFNAVTEAFLAEQLGGRYEPVGDDFEGSTITVPAGADHVPGLERSARRDAQTRSRSRSEARVRTNRSNQRPLLVASNVPLRSATRLHPRSRATPLASSASADHNARMSRTFWYYFWFTFTRLGSGTGGSA